MRHVQRLSTVVRYVFAPLDRRVLVVMKQSRVHSVPHHPVVTMAHVLARCASVGTIPVVQLAIPREYRVRLPRDPRCPVEMVVRVYPVLVAFVMLDSVVMIVKHRSSTRVRIHPVSTEALAVHSQMVQSPALVPVD